MPPGGPPRRRSPYRLHWGFPVAGACAFLVVTWFLWLRPARIEAFFTSCRNHASFVGWALDSYLLANRQMPHVPGLPGEELVCRLDVNGASANCHMGAPGQSVGGWQMVNASPQAWDAILVGMRGKRIPVMWCGRPHRPGRRWKGTVRIVFAIGLHGDAYGSVAELIERNEGALKDGEPWLSYFRSAIEYGMPEEELKERLAEINAILRKKGEGETPLNVEGRKDYWKLAQPYQSGPGSGREERGAPARP